MNSIPKALTIAGSDSGGGAGIQADLKTFAALGVYGASALTAITAQNTVGVIAVHEIPTEIITAQIDAVLDDIGADAVKTGMLANGPIIGCVADALQRHGVPWLVVDPVMVAKSGDPLLREDAVEALRTRLLPLASVVTPNIPEAETLTGMKISSDGEVRRAAELIVELGAKSVVVKGGHREGPATDLFYDGVRFQEFSAPRIDTRNTHGTGCTFASAVAAGLARGMSVPEAVALAKDYVTEAIRRSFPLGRGHGPLNHFYKLWS
jgi:hydroxymethylpyrimidine/phosphomethylpyrimidine kinase